ncbi:MAG: imidazolonepropionase [Myxococcaceae bacterium]
MWFYNIGTLFTGTGFLHNTALKVENGRIAEISDHITGDVDCKNQVILPGFIDCHTHLVFAGSRAHEFEMRSRGASYAEIMQAGGGIRNTMKATREASKNELIAFALPRLQRMLSRGVTSIEIKTGYGLSLESELKMLDVIAELQKLQPIEISPTFLGAHAFPPEFDSNREDYVNLIINDMLPAVKQQNIAQTCDVFIENGAFSVQQARKILEKALELGLKIRVHAEQLSHSGGTLLAAELKALSASHLEYATQADAMALAKNSVIAELLPTAQEFLGMKQLASGRMLSDAGVKVAVATDFNPGSAMCDDLQLAARLAVTRGGLTCEEALLGITRYAALALGSTDIGVLEVGSQADFCILSTSNWTDLFYDWSVNPIQAVYKRGSLHRSKDLA